MKKIAEYVCKLLQSDTAADVISLYSGVFVKVCFQLQSFWSIKYSGNFFEILILATSGINKMFAKPLNFCSIFLLRSVS